MIPSLDGLLAEVARLRVTYDAAVARWQQGRAP